MCIETSLSQLHMISWDTYTCCVYNSVWSARHERWIPVRGPTPRIRNPTSVTSFSFAAINVAQLKFDAPFVWPPIF
jgi:hypothetical protein